MSLESVLNDIHKFSQWNDRSKELFVLNDQVKSLLPECEYKDLLEQIERLITMKFINEEDKKEVEKFGDEIDKIIENKQFENKVNKNQWEIEAEHILTIMYILQMTLNFMFTIYSKQIVLNQLSIIF